MYLAPLNYDRFFKKVFSELHIAQRFLEDFFDIEIEEIESLPTKHKITDNATAVEFDFRCKVKGSYIIIDMQQWFKTDIIKRFYAYHSLNTVLQLEKIPDKSLPVEDKKHNKVKDYENILPVLTLIWLADDSLGFTDDFVSYTMTSETVNDFIKNKNIWREDNVLEILKEREKCLKILSNSTKNLDFLQENKLIYAFQQNIVKNKKLTKYLQWFEFAEKTSDKRNEKSWFEEYMKDEVFVEIASRINTDSFITPDWQYIEDYNRYEEQLERYKNSVRKDAKTEMALNIAINMKKLGVAPDIIAQATGLTIKQIDNLE
jgi:hypothetical protein